MNKFIYISLCSLVFLFTSCEKWLDVEPEGEATTEKLTGTGDGFRSMLGGVYKAMGAANLYGRELQFGIVECLAQEYTWSWCWKGQEIRTGIL